jgi:antitoxin component of RelBE/YafQ-DinJ toxin-antitoxin module
MKDKQLQVRIESELHDKALAKSKRTNITLSDVVRRALQAWIEEDRLPNPKHHTPGRKAFRE